MPNTNEEVSVALSMYSEIANDNSKLHPTGQSGLSSQSAARPNKLSGGQAARDVT